MRSPRFCILFLLLSPTLIFSQASGPWLISCGPESVIRQDTSESDLKKLYGDALQRTDIEIGEGMTEPGSLVFGSDDEKEISVTWRDPNTRLHPKVIEVSKHLSAQKSSWHTVSGISLGTSLQEVEHINGRTFKLAGFEFDGAGFVASWEGGKLIEVNTATCSARLAFEPEASTSETIQNLIHQVSGGSEFSSSHPAMQKLNPKVYLIRIEFHSPLPRHPHK
jgi:hypothetical protein